MIADADKDKFPLGPPTNRPAPPKNITWKQRAPGVLEAPDGKFETNLPLPSSPPPAPPPSFDDDIDF